MPSRPSKIFYSTVTSQILRYLRATVDLINIVVCINLVLMRMKKQSGKFPNTISLFKMIFRDQIEALLFAVILNMCITICIYISNYSLGIFTDIFLFYVCILCFYVHML